VQGVLVEVRDLASGDLVVWHPFNAEIRALIEPLCRGCGYWQGSFNNWIVWASHAARVESEIGKLAVLP
jgi:hypothetical protein